MWVELHVDILDHEERRRHSKTIKGMNMGGHLSLWLPEGSRTIIKVGEDNVIFKMYQMHHSGWEIDKSNAIEKKEGTVNMKIIIEFFIFIFTNKKYFL